jgi:hypothetical protein
VRDRDSAEDGSVTVLGAAATSSSMLDLEPLIRHVDRNQLRLLRARGTRRDRADLARVARGALLSTLMSVIIVVGITGTVVGLPVMVAVMLWPDWIALVCVLAAIALAAGIGIPLGRWRWKVTGREWRFVPTWTHRWRMATLASANGLNYQPTVDGAPGTVLTTCGGTVWDVFADRSGTFFGNARPRGDSAQMLAPFGWSFVATRLPAAVPHMMLVPAAGSLIAVGREQRLRLEGDFDRWFHLYAPADYQRDALYVITPDLMALLIDQLPGSYVETIDDILVVTTPRPFEFGQPEGWQRVGRLLQTIVPKTKRQTRRYRDVRGDVVGEVAAAGRRLRAGVSLVGILALLFGLLNVLRIVLENINR